MLGLDFYFKYIWALLIKNLNWYGGVWFEISLDFLFVLLLWFGFFFNKSSVICIVVVVVVAVVFVCLVVVLVVVVAMAVNNGSCESL